MVIDKKNWCDRLYLANQKQIGWPIHMVILLKKKNHTIVVLTLLDHS